MSNRVGGAATTDHVAIKGVHGGAQPPPLRSVEAKGRRQAAGPAPGVARQNRQGHGSELFFDERRSEPRTRGITHLSDGSGVLYYTIRIGGDELLPREPSEVDGAAMVGQTSGFHVGQNDMAL